MVAVLDSTLESVDIAERIVRVAAREMGFQENTQYQIGMAVRESVVNAVVHGNRYNEHKKVRLSISREPGRLTVRVADEGKGFDINSLPDPVARENLLNQSGRGIFMMKTFMDEFEARRIEPTGTEFKLVKYLNKKP